MSARRRTDKERLDWIEKNRGEVYSTTSDEFTQGKRPRLIRFSVHTDNWKTGRGQPFDGHGGEARSLRDAIDRAMKQAGVR